MAMAGDPMEDARVNLNNCLIDLSIEHLDLKTNAKGFEKMADTSCTRERQMFFDIVAKDEQQYGSSKSEAEKYATEEVEGIINGFVESYKQHAAANTRPAKTS